jgi:HEAT repeat protein
MAVLKFRFALISAILVAVLPAVATPSELVQSPAPNHRQSQADGLGPVRELIQRGQWKDAWAALQDVKPTSAALDLRVHVALQLDRPDEALAAWDRLREEGGDANAALRRIGLYTARRLLGADDSLVVLESERLLATHGDRAAEQRLQRRLDESGTTALERAAAAATLASFGQKVAASRFAVLAQAIPTRDQFNLIRLTRRLPADVALKVLTPMLKSPASDVRYGAVLALGELGGPDVAAVLRKFLEAPPEGAARLAAMLALAAQGDRAMLEEVAKIAAHFGPRENLAYARALIAVGDPLANRFIGLVQNGDDEMLRLEAAALLAKMAPATGRDLLVGALGHPNVWVRVRALELLRDTKPEPVVFAHMLTGAEDWIRLRSAELVFAEPMRPARGAAQPANRRGLKH